MDYVKSFELDFDPLELRSTITAKQYDCNSRSLLIVPVYRGDKIDIRDCTAVIYAERPDRVVVCIDCDINDDGNIVAEIEEQAVKTDGLVKCDVKLYKDDAVFSSSIFYLDVVKAVALNNIINAYQKRNYTTIVKIKSGNSYYTLQIGECLVFTLKDQKSAANIISKEFTDYVEEKNGYLLKLNSNDLHIPAGQYFYNIALKRSNGTFDKVIGNTIFNLEESAGG